MDRNLQELEDRLAGLVPRAVSEEGSRKLDDEIDRLAAEVEGDRVRKGRRWFWPGLGAAASLAWGAAMLPTGRETAPTVDRGGEPAATMQLVSLSRQVTGVSDSEWVLGDGSARPYRYRSFLVTGTEEFIDDASGLAITVISESEERVPIILTQL